MAGGSGMTNVPGSKPMLVPMGSQVQMASPWAANQPAWMQGGPSWRQPLFPMGLLSPQMLPGMQAQIAAQTPQQPMVGMGNDQPTGNPQPDKPVTPTPTTPTAPTQSAVSTAMGSSIDPSVMAGLSAAERANYDIDPASGTWIRVR